jgi:hypothetical protein
MLAVGPVGKVPVLDLGGNVQKSDRAEISTIDDLMLGRGKVTPENSVKFVKKTFSTDSLATY